MKRIILHSVILIILLEIVGLTILSLRGPEVNLVGLFLVCFMMFTEIYLLHLAKTTTHA